MKRLIFAVMAFCCLVGSVSGSDFSARDRYDARIGIVGAGAAGLTAALSLSDMGYRNVTVFESGDQVGGKVRSITIENRVYELGSSFVLPDFNTVFELADRFGVPYKDSGLEHRVVDARGETHNMMDFPQSAFGLESIIHSMIRFDLFRFFHHNALKDNFAEAPDSLNINFDLFAERHGFKSLALSAAPMMVGCGYGYLDQIPALYLMRLMNSFVPVFRKAMLFPGRLDFPNFVATFPYGYQSLWQEIGRHLNVHLNTPVTRVVRNRGDHEGTQILVTAGGQIYHFDQLVIAAPLDKAVQFLDASSEERDLFRRIRYSAYMVTLFRGTNLDKPAITFLDAHTRSTAIGRMTGLYNQYADNDIWTAGQIGTWSTGTAAMTSNLREDVARMGGEVGEILAQQTWSHFPHVTTEDLDQGFYQRLERLQGVSGTYYVGGIMNFDSVEHTARFARDLMRRKF